MGRPRRISPAHEEAAGLTGFPRQRRQLPRSEGEPAQPLQVLPACHLGTSGTQGGVTGLLHPDGVYDDPKGGQARRAVYQQLRRHYQFVNELTLFREVAPSHVDFSVNVYGPAYGRRSIPTHRKPVSCHRPSTTATHTPAPAQSRASRTTTTTGILAVTEIASFTLTRPSSSCSPSSTTSPIHRQRRPGSRRCTRRSWWMRLRAFADAPMRLGRSRQDRVSRHVTCGMSRVRAARMGRHHPPREFVSHDPPATGFSPAPTSSSATRSTRRPRAEVTNNSHYDVLDLIDLPEDYLPRTIYVPNVSPAEYRARAPKRAVGERRGSATRYSTTTGSW